MKKRVNALNYLRFLAMITVIFQHAYSGKLTAQAGLSSFVFKLPAWGGVWIFFILSGYLIGNGFYGKRYELSLQGIVKFYKKRFCKIAISYYLYCFIWMMFCGEKWFINNPQTVLKILTFTFNGVGGTSGIGHLWYVSTAMQLYLLSPLIYICLKNVRKEKTVFWLLFVGGLAARLFLEDKGYAWYTYIYTNVFTNLDLFAGGMLLNVWTTAALKKNENLTKRDRTFRITAFVIMHILILLNAFMLWTNTSLYVWIYKYFMPSIYLLACACYILAFECYGEEYKSLQLTLKPMAVIDILSSYSYEMYLVHIVVLNTVKLWLGEIRTEVCQVIYLLLIIALSFGAGVIFRMAAEGLVKKISGAGEKRGLK